MKIGDHPFVRSGRAIGPYVTCYWVAISSGLLFAPASTASLWVGNGLLACALLFLDRRNAFLALAISIFLSVVTGLWFGRAPLRIACVTSMNVVEILLLAGLTAKAFGRDFDFSNGRRLMLLLGAVVLPSTVVVSILLTILLALVKLPAGSLASERWFAGHLLGAAVAIPATTVIVQRRRFAAMRRPPFEFGAAMSLLLVMCAVLFLGQSQFSGLFLIFPVMMLTAFRYGPVGAATGSFILAALCTLVGYFGAEHMYFGGDISTHAKILWVQVFVALVFLTTLPASGAVASYARLRTLLAQRTRTAREARHRADAAAAAKGEFLANMSHEIRTPLNGVIGLADALSRTDLTSAQREMLTMILSSGKALTGLLSDALDLARADSGALELVNEPFDVQETIGSAAYLFEAIAREKGLGFEVRFDLIPPGAAVGDALRIKQVVSNLISNAVKFTATGGVAVEVSLTPAGRGRLRLATQVRDTGSGFGPEVQARLFNRFEQGDSSVTRRFGGSGLGLSIAHRLVQMMQGTLACESHVGEGSTFTFEVELGQAAATAAGVARAVAATAVAPAPSAGPDKLSVLLAEDHPVNRKVIQAMLGDAVALTTVENGRAAVEAWAIQAFDAVLMDTHMPVMDGLTAIREIRAAEAAAGLLRTPIVSLTADAMPQHAEASMAAGADLHVTKPITGESLYAALAACMRLRDEAQGRGRPPRAAAG